MPTKRKSGLGSGLNELIPQKNKSTSGNTEEKDNVKTSDIKVDINKVEPNKDQPRQYFDEDKLLELSESIRQYGVIQPILVQKRDNYYEIVAGERRWRAAKMAGLKEVPVIIKEFTEQEIVEISIIENVQREDLNAMEEAMGYQRLLEQFNLKQDEVAEKVSKSRTAITNSLRLLKLDKRVQQMVKDDLLSAGHARAILGISDQDLQYEFAQKVFDEKMSVRDVEKEVKKLQKEKKKPAKEKETLDKQTVIIYQNLEENLKGILGTKINIQAKDDEKGKIEIEYYSKDELDRIVELLRSIRM
jgi:ParB family chromosome partitioning protein